MLLFKSMLMSGSRWRWVLGIAALILFFGFQGSASAQFTPTPASKSGPTQSYCFSNADCGSGYSCSAGSCVSNTTPTPAPPINSAGGGTTVGPNQTYCSTDSDCGAGYVCTNGLCLVNTSPTGQGSVQPTQLNGRGTAQPTQLNGQGTANGLATLPTNILSTPQDIANLLCVILRWMFWGLIALSIVMFMIGGYGYATAGGNSEKVSTANKRLLFAAIALVVGIVAAGIPSVISSFFGAGSLSVC